MKTGLPHLTPPLTLPISSLSAHAYAHTHAQTHACALECLCTHSYGRSTPLLERTRLKTCSSVHSCSGGFLVFSEYSQYCRCVRCRLNESSLFEGRYFFPKDGIKLITFLSCWYLTFSRDEGTIYVREKERERVRKILRNNERQVEAE